MKVLIKSNVNIREYYNQVNCCLCQSCLLMTHHYYVCLIVIVRVGGGGVCSSRYAVDYICIHTHAQQRGAYSGCVVCSVERSNSFENATGKKDRGGQSR